MAGSRLTTKFWKLWTAATVSNLGDGIAIAAVPLLAARLTREPMAVAATTIAVRLPWLVFALVAGVVVDRSDRLRTMISTDAGRALLFAVMAALVFTDSMTLTILYGAVFVVGLLETIFDTAAMSITPSIVAADRLDHANARLDSAFVVTNELLGPALGGLLFAAGAFIPFGANAATFVMSVALLSTVGGSFKPRVSKTASLHRDIREGFAFLWRQPGIRAFAIGAGVINLGYTAGFSLLVLQAEDNLGMSDVGFGLLLASSAVGGVLGSIGAPKVIGALGRRRSVMTSVLVLAVGVAVVGLTSVPWIAALALAVFGFGGGVWNIVSVTHRQTRTPDALLGRVMSGFRLIAYGAFPIGAALGGLIASVFGLRATFYFGAAVIAALFPLLLLILPAGTLAEDEGET